MKIENKAVAGFINTITKQEDFKIVLLYGEDNSSVTEKYNTIINSFISDGYDNVLLSSENVKNNPSLLADELFSSSMFSSKSVYSLKLLDRENDYTKYVEALTSNSAIENIENFLIITAGGLDVKSSLRKLAEKSKYIACIACYEDSNPEIFINRKLKEYGFIFNSEIVNYIATNIGSNTLIISREIEKLFLYKSNDKNLTLEDLKLCIKDISNGDMNDFCNNFCLLNLNETIRVYRKIISNGTDCIALIRVLIKYLTQLQKIKCLLEENKDIASIFKSENIFWKQQNIMKIHLSKLSLPLIDKILKNLFILEKEIKFDTNKNIIFENFILKSLIFCNKK